MCSVSDSVLRHASCPILVACQGANSRPQGAGLQLCQAQESDEIIR
jgi:hypothetical protein